jgi:Raf kinase inhibitor-like YbhB/YbcL family protein
VNALRREPLNLALAGLLLVAGCSDSTGGVDEPTVGADSTLTVTSAAFEDGGTIPERFTCDGQGDVPPLAWSGDLAGAGAVAVVVDDPDAPDGTYVHWIVLDLPPGTTTLDAAPAVGAEAENSSGDTGWMPPCPPSGTHHYRFTVYGLRSPTGLEDGAGTEQALDAIADAAVVQGRLTGLVSG